MDIKPMISDEVFRKLMSDMGMDWTPERIYKFVEVRGDEYGNRAFYCCLVTGKIRRNGERIEVVGPDKQRESWPTLSTQRFALLSDDAGEAEMFRKPMMDPDVTPMEAYSRMDQLIIDHCVSKDDEYGNLPLLSYLMWKQKGMMDLA